MASINDLYKVTLWCQYANQGGLMVSHWKCTAIGGVGMPDQVVANKFFTYFKNDVRALLVNDAFFQTVGVAKINPGPVSITTWSTELPVNGTAGATGLPKQTSGIITLQSALAGRSNRGRKYMPFPATDDDTGNGSPTGGYITRLQNLGDLFVGNVTFVSGVDSLTFTSVIYSPTAGGTVQVIGRRANPRFATQRRRGDYGRPNVPPA